MVFSPAFVGIVAIAFLVGALVGPLFVNTRLRDVRTPTPTDRERLDALRRDVGPDVEHVRIVETVGEASIEVSVRGPPGYRVLFVTDYVLEDLDEETARALLAAEAGRNAVRYDEYRAVTASIAIAIGVASFGGVIPFSPGFTALVVVAVIMLAIGRWLQYRADARAADAVGPDVVADAFETVATLHGKEIDTGGWRTVLEIQPPLGNRIERLRER